MTVTLELFENPKKIHGIYVYSCIFAFHATHGTDFRAMHERVRQKQLLIEHKSLHVYTMKVSIENMKRGHDKSVADNTS